MKRRDIQPFGLRIPPRLREMLEQSASDHRQSLTAEILERLEASYEGQATEQLYDDMKRIVTEAMVAGSKAFFDRAMIDDKPDVAAAQRDMTDAIERVFDQSKTTRFPARIHEPGKESYRQD